MLPEVRKILYSTDLSKGSTAAFEHAAYLAKKTGAEIHILHVVEKLSADAKITFKTYVMDAGSRRDFFEERLNHAKQKLAERQETFWRSVDPDERKIREQIKEIHVVESYPAEAILKLSKELEVDLIIMGTHEKGIMHTFLGSVAKNVLNRSRIPMMIVPLPELESD
ncbi:universal stress protein [Marinobacterium arenosum]|uniref:universal stress protein n=1 Tax=Marinobacterium arenosum TaxID=2862496 RepID=UPI001C96359B|nr:universal stress protein [Marinobacterium arenosum]MBY4678927.1 universal stress protein [Marinobacterium arenosum]